MTLSGAPALPIDIILGVSVALFTDRILRIPPGGIVVTIGSAGSGKTTWAKRQFPNEHILSLDECRRLVAGSETEYEVTGEAFELLLLALEGRARRQITTLVDGTFVQADQRRALLDIARLTGRPTVAVCFRVPEELAQFRSRSGNRMLSSKLLRRQVQLVNEFVEGHAAEGWGQVVFFGDTDVDLLPAVRFTLPEPLPHPGPFDIIGDVHGCLGELDRLLDRLGWLPPEADATRRHPDGRTAVFVGDYADRGPDSAGVFRRVMAMHAAGTALGVPGNHCAKLVRYLNGRPTTVTHGLHTTLDELEREGDAFKQRVKRFLESLPQTLVLAGGKLVIFHAALQRDRVGQQDQATWAQTTYGVVRGTDENGYPIRDTTWTQSWPTGDDEPLAIYGHTPVRSPLRMSNTIDIDGGCVFGGYLAAYRWPERTLAFEPAAKVWYESAKMGWRGAPEG
jgi:protein phosphatase